MSEKEKKSVEKLKRAISNYILGKTEKMAEESVKKQGGEREVIKN